MSKTYMKQLGTVLPVDWSGSPVHSLKIFLIFNSSQSLHLDKRLCSLVRTALQQSATDPSTGLIDMDLLTTGHSMSSRARIANLPK
jgi:hypothetical protein